MTWRDLPTNEQILLNQRLTIRQHDVLVLTLAGCSLARIAVMLQVSIRTVRTHLHRARQIHDDVRKETAA